MSVEDVIRFQAPSTLGVARSIAHRAVQLLTAAARANLKPQPDDSHSNLGWDSSAQHFLSHSFAGADGECHAALSLSPLQLLVLGEGRPVAALDLDGIAYVEAATWLDNQLVGLGLKAASQVELPYALPAEVEAVDVFGAQTETAALEGLAGWYDLAATTLSRFVAQNEGLRPGPGPVRCWPHHFDIATYVQLEDGDFEAARGVGIGMSPGDESYARPYFYINPWPHLDPARLAEAPVPGHWHTEGFVGLIATAEEILTLGNTAAGLSDFVDAAFSVGRDKLGV